MKINVNQIVLYSLKNEVMKYIEDRQIMSPIPDGYPKSYVGQSQTPAVCMSDIEYIIDDLFSTLEKNFTFKG